MYGFGNNKYGQISSFEESREVNQESDFGKKIFAPKLICKDQMIKSIHCGEDHSLILKWNGELYSMGKIFFFLKK